MIDQGRPDFTLSAMAKYFGGGQTAVCCANAAQRSMAVTIISKNTTSSDITAMPSYLQLREQKRPADSA